MHKMRNTLAKVRKRDAAGVPGDLRRVSTPLRTLNRHRQRGSGSVGGSAMRWSPGWEEDLSSFLCFLRYPAAIRPYRRSMNPLERFIREVRRGTKVRDHQFLSAEAVKKLVHLECGRQEDKREKRLRRFMEAQEVLGRRLQEWYSYSENGELHDAT
ncbi:MAG: transposase [Candidatus Methanomethyliaceae archaeon]